jgi:hypothetical protein
MILFTEKPEESTKWLTRTNKQLWKGCRPCDQYTKLSYAYLCTSNEQYENEIMETIPFTIVSKQIIYLWIKLTKKYKTQVLITWTSWKKLN